MNFLSILHFIAYRDIFQLVQQEKEKEDHDILAAIIHLGKQGAFNEDEESRSKTEEPETSHETCST